jgi:phosphate transport system substrate-binding protein
VKKLPVPAVGLLLAVLVLAACGGDEDGDAGGNGETLSGRVVADGSSTVGPFTTRAAERFRGEEPDVQVTVGVSGTGGGFERFCAGETDLSNASRPIKAEEAAVCAREGVDYVEFHVANDALTVVVSKENDWVSCLTVDQLERIWRPGSQVERWNQVDPAFPAQELQLFGPGTDSGTFDYFTDAVNGEEGASRSDYTASENDNVIVRGVAGSPGGLGYLGFSYYEENAGELKALEVDGGDGCVAPGAESVQDSTYEPLARPLFVYVKQVSLEQPHVRAFVRYVLENAAPIAEEARFVPLTDRQLQRAQRSFTRATAGS